MLLFLLKKQIASYFSLRMAANSKMSKMAGKDEQFTFGWKVFTGWDYMIGNAETADNRVAAISTTLKVCICDLSNFLSIR